MKKLKYFIVLVVAIVTIGLNLKNENVCINDISLENIRTMQASAGEMYCDSKTQVKCVIKYDGGTGVGKGNLINIK